MEVSSDNRTTTIHELMSSPINQSSKSSLGKYVTHLTIKSSDESFKYSSNINRSDFYNEHSNIMMVKVRRNKITYEVIRTSNGDRKEMDGSYVSN